MQDFEKIKVIHSTAIELIVDNPTDLKLIDKGAHGAVFRLSEDKCVKVYADADIAKMEADAYKLSQHSSFIPRIYEAGVNYIVLEYVKGISLLEFLELKKEIPLYISRQLVLLLMEMKHLGFTRLDSSLRHIIITNDGCFKLIDLVNAYNQHETIPKRALKELREHSLLSPFLKHLKEINPELYVICQEVLHE